MFVLDRYFQRYLHFVQLSARSEMVGAEIQFCCTMTLVYTHAKFVNELWNLQTWLVAKLGVQVGLQPPLCDLILAANMGTLNVASIGISAAKPGDWTGQGISVGNMDMFTATCAFCQDNHIRWVAIFVSCQPPPWTGCNPNLKVRIPRCAAIVG